VNVSLRVVGDSEFIKIPDHLLRERGEHEKYYQVNPPERTFDARFKLWRKGESYATDGDVIAFKIPGYDRDARIICPVAEITEWTNGMAEKPPVHIWKFKTNTFNFSGEPLIPLKRLAQWAQAGGWKRAMEFKIQFQPFRPVPWYKQSPKDLARDRDMLDEMNNLTRVLIEKAGGGRQEAGKEWVDYHAGEQEATQTPAAPGGAAPGAAAPTPGAAGGMPGDAGGMSGDAGEMPGDAGGMAGGGRRKSKRKKSKRKKSKRRKSKRKKSKKSRNRTKRRKSSKRRRRR